MEWSQPTADIYSIENLWLFIKREVYWNTKWKSNKNCRNNVKNERVQKVNTNIITL